MYFNLTCIGWAWLCLVLGDCAICMIALLEFDFVALVALDYSGSAFVVEYTILVVYMLP